MVVEHFLKIWTGRYISFGYFRFLMLLLPGGNLYHLKKWKPRSERTKTRLVFLVPFLCSITLSILCIPLYLSLSLSPSISISLFFICICIPAINVRFSVWLYHLLFGLESVNKSVCLPTPLYLSLQLSSTVEAFVIKIMPLHRTTIHLRLRYFPQTLLECPSEN